MKDSNHTPKFTIAYYSVFKSDKYLVNIAEIDLYQFTEMINIFRVGTPQQFI